MNLSYPVISSPLYQERPGINTIKNTKIISKNNSKKPIVKNRKNTGIVNNMDQHITAGIVAFINWLADTVKEIQEADVRTTCMQKDNKEKISPRRAKRMAARKNSKKCKKVLQTYETLQTEVDMTKKEKNLRNIVTKIEKKDFKKANAKKIEALKTIVWVSAKRSQYEDAQQMLLKLKRQEMLQEAKKEKEAQDIAQWVISVRKLQNMTDYLQYTLPEDIQDEEEFVEYDENQTDYNEVYEKARGNIRAVINTFNCKSK